MTDAAPITIDVISDAVCPWCFIGQKRLDQALAAASEVEVTVRWRPYQLDPTIPPEGKDRKAYMEDKFGSPDRIRSMHDRVEESARDTDIAFRFDDITVSPNTLDAHRVVRWAGGKSDEVQGKVMRRIFKAYFEEGQDIGDHRVLATLAGEAGMDSAVVESLLATDADKAEVHREIEMASRMGVKGVPCFLIESRYAVVGAQDTATLTDAIRQIAAAKARGELDQLAG